MYKATTGDSSLRENEKQLSKVWYIINVITNLWRFNTSKLAEMAATINTTEA